MGTTLDLSTKPRARAALDLATEHHRGISRKYDGGPYIAHPISVAERLISAGFGYSEDVLCAALLHDCLEDKNAAGFVMPDRVISGECGLKVMRWVQLLTKPTRGNRASRNERYTKQLLTAPPEVMAIKLADILDNITGLAALDPKFAPVYLEEKEKQARAFKPVTGDTNFAALRRTTLLQVSEERNALALQTLHMMQAIENDRVASAAEVAALIAEEEHSVYADYAMF